MGKKKGNVISVDFTGVEAGGGGKLIPEGPTQLELIELEEKEGEESGKPYLEAKFKVAEGENEGVTVYDNFSLQPQALWKLRGFLDAAGVATEDGPMDIPHDDVIGVIVVADIVHEEYKGKDKNRIAGYSAVDGASEPADDTSGGGTKVKKKAGGDGSETEWKVKQKVTFMEGKKKLEGVIVKLYGEDKVDVRVGKDEYEMTTGDLEAA